MQDNSNNPKMIKKNTKIVKIVSKTAFRILITIIEVSTLLSIVLVGTIPILETPQMTKNS